MENFPLTLSVCRCHSLCSTGKPWQRTTHWFHCPRFLRSQGIVYRSRHCCLLSHVNHGFCGRAGTLRPVGEGEAAALAAETALETEEKAPPRLRPVFLSLLGRWPWQWPSQRHGHHGVSLRSDGAAPHTSPPHFCFQSKTLSHRPHPWCEMSEDGPLSSIREPRASASSFSWHSNNASHPQLRIMWNKVRWHE